MATKSIGRELNDRQGSFCAEYLELLGSVAVLATLVLALQTRQNTCRA